ncbi:MAG: DUF192 domain-containing protein [Candidatus Pacebacteria bacterium]|nr:DUF192 domain-containing protein [Candidatus Paceibacterota bacterium]
MKNKSLFVLLFLFFLLFIVLTMLEKYNIKKYSQVCFKDNCFDVEIAKTPEQRSRGLMFRKYLGTKKGMLFVFENQEKHSFWMKNTLIPLDIIWINENQKVVFISKNTQPCKQEYCASVSSDEDAKYVLEINAGLVKKIGLNIGDKIDIIY